MRCRQCSERQGRPFKRSHLVALRTSKITAANPKFDGAISRQLPCAFSCRLVIWRDELDLPHDPTRRRPAQVDAILVVRKLVPVTQAYTNLTADFERP